ncbi:M16 family metallopeptidase [Plebeiibacterium marinum]|uniref:Insulinase family protein n=1 Tax=Plebeiibacterium marinum TaxID=2992111 RepID=A0AAE3MDZ0_9BACT|nr:pitrilysin family protein [Plebeiobacterium marinum]MCW3805999.1 insulinase family protein [Plebeiobacterium marinum]
MLARNTAPSFVLPAGLSIIDGKEFKLNNGIPVHVINGGTQDVVKIDFIFPAGSVQAQKPLVASFTNHLMQEGTVGMTSAEISEKIDYYGAFLGQSVNYHHAQITLYALTKYLPELLPVIEDIIKKPTFSKHEFDVYLSKKRQDFHVDSEKVKVLSHRESLEVLFGEDHPYGKVAKLKHYDALKISDLKEFHKAQYSSDLCRIIVAGKTNSDFNNLLNQYFGGDDWHNNTEDVSVVPDVPAIKGGLHIVKKDNAIQSALRIVRLGVTKSHPDFLPLMVLNTLFGGYFGSRLMANLREEKGLTYGISSFITSFVKAGMIGVSTEVLAEKRELAVEEVFAEMEKLRSEVVSDEELTRVKNYMLGDLMRNLDGPFALSEAYRGLLGFDLTIGFFNELEQTIINITAEEIKELAVKYLVKDDFHVVVAGK